MSGHCQIRQIIFLGSLWKMWPRDGHYINHGSATSCLLLLQKLYPSYVNEAENLGERRENACSVLRVLYQTLKRRFLIHFFPNTGCVGIDTVFCARRPIHQHSVSVFSAGGRTPRNSATRNSIFFFKSCIQMSFLLSRIEKWTHPLDQHLFSGICSPVWRCSTAPDYPSHHQFLFLVAI